MANLSSVMERAKAVRLLILDVDGVLTDGSLQYGIDGETLKTFNVLDGLGIQMLQRTGVATAIISARKSAIVNKRASDLGINIVIQGSHDKLSGFNETVEKLGLRPEQCGFMGDDVIDLPVLTRVGFAVSVPNGRPEVHQVAHYVTDAGGGRGAVREVCEMIMRAQGTFETALQPYLK